MVSMSSAAPAAMMMRRVASMISGPMPSPCATVIGTFFAVAISVKALLLGEVEAPRIRRSGVRALDAPSIGVPGGVEAVRRKPLEPGRRHETFALIIDER